MIEPSDVEVVVNDVPRTLPVGATCRDLVSMETGRVIGNDGCLETGEGLGVAFAEDAGGAEGRGDEVGGGLAVGLDDELLGGGLCKRGRMSMSAIERKQGF